MQSLLRASVWAVWIVGLILCAGPALSEADPPRSLTGGWSPYPPYSYIERVKGIQHWKGLDVELLRAIVERAEYSIDVSEVAWVKLVGQIKTGARDIAAGATRTAAREEFAHFSVPYRTETLVLIHRTDGPGLAAASIGSLLQRVKSEQFRVGINPGTAYPSHEVQTFVADPVNDDVVIEVPVEHFPMAMQRNEIDGYFVDRIVAAAIIEAHRPDLALIEHPVRVESHVHLMFSKASVPPEVVADFNQAIRDVHADGTYQRLNQRYTFPILVGLTVNSDWFITVDIVGTIAFALSGLLLAFRYNYDIFGALVLAALPAVGGGIVRDLITNRETLAVLSSPIYLEIVGVLVVGGYATIRVAMAIRKSALGMAAAELFERRRRQVGSFIQICDAIGLAAFTVTGVVVALATQSKPLLLWGPILAAITAAGGGILRDVVRSDQEISTLKGELYPEIAILWGFILTLYFRWQARHLNADEVAFGIILTFLGAFLTRLATIYFGLRSPRFSA